MKVAKIAVIGCGAVAEVFHLPTLMRMPEFEIKALVDIYEDRINSLKKKFQLDCRIETDYKKALLDDEIESVMVLTPPKYHHQIVIDAAKAGKDIFCEKPFAMSVKEAEDMVKTCRDSDVRLMVGFNYRFFPQYRKIKEMIDKGFFGKLVGGQFTLFGNAFSWPSVSKFQYSKKEGGGALFEMGVHHVDLMNWYFGEPESVIAKIDSLTNNNIDDTAFVYVRYKNGANCTITTGWNRLSVNTINIIGIDGCAAASASKNEILYYRKDLIGQPPIRIKVKRSLSPYQEELIHFHRLMTNGNNNNIEEDREILNSVNVIENAYKTSKEN